MEPLYFAYGSNLDIDDWAEFCNRHNFDPNSIEAIQPARMPDYELGFNVFSRTRGGGALNIKSRKGGWVNGALFRVNQNGWNALDFKEGVNDDIYRRTRCCVIGSTGNLISAITYVVTDLNYVEFVKPTQHYQDVVEKGLRRFRHDTSDLYLAAKNRPLTSAQYPLFIYGTLLEGESRSHQIARFSKSSSEEALMRGTLYATDRDYPMLDIFGDPSTNLVKGQLIAFDDISSAISCTDLIEDFFGFENANNEFARTISQVRVTETTDPVLAWVYVVSQRERLRNPIPSGCWRTFNLRRSHNLINDPSLNA